MKPDKAPGPLLVAISVGIYTSIHLSYDLPMWVQIIVGVVVAVILVFILPPLERFRTYLFQIIKKAISRTPVKEPPEVKTAGPDKLITVEILKGDFYRGYKVYKPGQTVEISEAGAGELVKRGIAKRI